MNTNNIDEIAEKVWGRIFILADTTNKDMEKYLNKPFSISLYGNRLYAFNSFGCGFITSEIKNMNEFSCDNENFIIFETEYSLYTFRME